MSKSEQNRANKEEALINSAYDLFEKKGINKTTIDSIVKNAGVAKGTFYLYFKSKYDIFDRIILDKTSALIHAAVEETFSHQYENHSDQVVFFITYMIDYLANHKLLMKIIHKNLSFSLYRKLVTYTNSNDIQRIIDDVKNDMPNSIYNGDEINDLLFILIEMTGSVCYSSIIYNEPAPIELLKPLIIKTIKKIFE